MLNNLIIAICFIFLVIISVIFIRKHNSTQNENIKLLYDILLALIVIGYAVLFTFAADKIIPAWILDPITDSPQTSLIALIISLFGSKPLAKSLSIENVYIKAAISLLIYITSIFLLVYIFSLV